MSARSQSGGKKKGRKASKTKATTSKAPRNPENIGKPHRFRPGTVALRQIRQQQKNVDLLVAKLPFQRIVRELATNVCKNNNGINIPGDQIRFTASSMLALQQSAEAYMITLYEDCQLCAFHGKRITIMPRDMKLVRHLRGPGSL